MATRTEIILVCDMCGKMEGAKTHVLGVDSKTVEVEACGTCWTKLHGHLEKPLKAGRKQPSRRRKAA